MPTQISATIDQPLKPQSRQELYDLAWQEPMLRIAERFGVSSSYLARVFTELRVPRPGPGYWAQREFGKAPSKPELPPARPGDLTEWNPGASIGAAVRTVTKAHRAAEKGSASTGNEEASPSAVNTKRSPRRAVSNESRRHELLVGVKPLFLKTRRIENDILRPYKRLLVDVMASEKKLDDALDSAQALFEALTLLGMRVCFAPIGEPMPRAEIELLDKPSRRPYHRTLWTPERPTVVYVGDTAIGLTLIEMTEEVEMVYVNGSYLAVRDLSEQQLRRYSGTHHWRTHKEHASGRLCLQAYCPSWRVKWSKQWREATPGEFVKLIPNIIKELQAAAPQLVKQLEEERLRAEEEQRRWMEEERRRKAEAERARREKAIQDAKRDLLTAIAAWDETRRINSFFASADAQLTSLSEESAVPIRERLNLAKELVGELDPLALLRSWKAPTER